MKKDLICFDLDNTLIDSERAHVLSYNEALKKNGFKEVKFEKMVKLFGRPNSEVVEILTGSKNEEIMEKVHKDHYKFLIEKNYKYAKIIDGVRNTLIKLKKNYEIAVLSNTSHNSIIALLKGAKLDKKLFDLLIGNDDVEKSKPWPDEILKAEKLLHHKAKFMVGDSIYDVIAGKKAKVKTIAVLSGRYTKKELNKHKPDYVIKEIKDILEII